LNLLKQLTAIHISNESIVSYIIKFCWIVCGVIRSIYVSVMEFYLCVLYVLCIDYIFIKDWWLTLLYISKLMLDSYVDSYVYNKILHWLYYINSANNHTNKDIVYIIQVIGRRPPRLIMKYWTCLNRTESPTQNFTQITTEN